MRKPLGRWAFLSLSLTFSSFTALHAGEPVCEGFCEPETPIVSKIPYLNRLFKNVGVGRVDGEGECFTCEASAPNCQQCEAANSKEWTARPANHIGRDGLERIGVDFDFANAPRVNTCVPPVPPPLAFFIPAPPPLAYAQDHHPVEALRAEFEEQRSELIEALLEARVQNAQLAARLEFADEREKLVVENALLKAQAMPVATTNEVAQLRDENAALKAKLAALEERLAKRERPARAVADKGTTKRK